MTEDTAIKLFEEKKIRSVWNDKKEEWYFSIVDIIGALTNSVNPKDYFKKLRKRDAELDVYVGTNCPPVSMLTETGKHRQTLAGNAKDILRIV
ncbi:MAG: hypothetical protein Q4Q53_06275, partial [Methanocorpusculum sp.]|nr:hypothetical protein [Methanocorpusculum sp.]